MEKLWDSQIINGVVVKLQFGGQFTYAVGGGALDAPLLYSYVFALVFGEYELLSAGPSRAPAPTP